MDGRDHRGHADLSRLLLKLASKAAVKTHDFAGLTTAYAVSKLIGPAVGFEMLDISVEVHVRKADAVTARVIIRDFKISPGERGQVTVSRAIHERFGVDCLSAGPAVHYHASYAAAFHDGAGE